MIVKLAERSLLTKFGLYREVLYYDGQKESIALVFGDVYGKSDVLCRVHSACIAAHVFNSIECDCREQMEIAQTLIQKADQGVVIWLDQEGRGNGHFALMNCARVSAEEGISQTEAYRKIGFEEDGRRYTRAAEILTDLGVSSVVLVTNNPEKSADLVAVGIRVTGTRQAIGNFNDNENLRGYYSDKIARGHDIKI